MNRGRRNNGNSRHRGSSRGTRNYDRNPKRSYSTDIRKIKNDDPGKRLSEASLGITEYVGDHPGFNGIIKARYSDFQVNEIDESGFIAKLTERGVPPMPKGDEDSDMEDDDDSEENPNKYNTKVLPLDTWKQIEDLLKKANAVVKVDATDFSKEERTKVHNAVKQRFGNAVVGSTLNEENKKYIKFIKYNKHDPRDKRVKWLWPGQWVHFLLHKENLDTMQAAVELGSILKMKPGNITYAGTKDRRAKTTQWFCIRKTQPERLVNACKNVKKFVIGNFTFKDSPLRLGQLKGNRFRIALRNVTAEDEVVEKALHNLRENGFINYYGLQRFGSAAEIPTHRIGLALIKGDYKQAVELILKPRDDENDANMRAARDEWWNNRDSVAALSHLNSYNLSVEAKLLKGLIACAPKDYATALGYIPRNMRLLYIHSYQSYIWNLMVSKRIKNYGLGLLVGDLVLTDQVDEDEIIEDADNIIHSGEAIDEISEENPSVKAVEDMDTSDRSPDKFQDNNPNLKTITQDDVDSGVYSIFDVVLPLPGYDIVYPQNEIASWYDEILEEDGLTLSKMKNKVKIYSLSGAYRKIISQPEKMSWSMQYYNDPNDSLIVSDLEELNGESLTNKKDGRYKALIIDFCLKSSTYATMALRELLKHDTSSQSQAKLNSYHSDQPTDVPNESNTIMHMEVAPAVEKRKLEQSDDTDKRPKLEN